MSLGDKTLHGCWLESNIIDCNEIRAFYRFANSKSSCHSDVGTLIGPDGKTKPATKKKRIY